MMICMISAHGYEFELRGRGIEGLGAYAVRSIAVMDYRMMWLCFVQAKFAEPHKWISEGITRKSWHLCTLGFVHGQRFWAKPHWYVRNGRSARVWGEAEGMESASDGGGELMAGG